MPRPAPVASLPMYDHPALREATDAFWAALAAELSRRGIEAPERLDRREDHAAPWLEPGLVLSQTCGYPYATRLRGRLRLVATPAYAAPGCAGARYSSALVVRVEDPARDLADLRGRRAAVNASDSQSGMNVLRLAVAPLARGGRFFGATIETGSHAASARAVAGDRADLAAIDCVTFALLGRHEPEVTGRLRVLAWSASAPGLPYVTGAARPEAEVAAMRDALAAVMTDPSLDGVREALMLRGMEVLPDAAYDAIGAMEAEAAQLGYPRLR